MFFLKTKDQAFEKFVKWKLLVENQTGLKVKKLRTDNGLEFCNKEFDKFCSYNGTGRHKAIPYTPQQNDVVERMKRTILERVRSILNESGLPKVFWAEAVNIAVYVVNRLPASDIGDKVPEELWSKTFPKLDHLRRFGCVCYYHSDDGKLQPRAKKDIFIGYPGGVKGYKVWSLEDKRAVVSRNMTFKEGECYTDLKRDNIEQREKNTTFLDLALTESEQVNGSGGEILSEHQTKGATEEVGSETEETSESHDRDTYQLVIDRIRREVKHPKKFDDYVYMAMYVSEDGDCVEPSDYKSAMKDPQKKKWIMASDEEMDSLQKNHTWDLVKKPRGRKVIGCKWIYKRKPGIPGIEEPRYKSRLVAKGYAQKEGVDCNEILSPVVKHVSIRYLMSTFVNEDLELEQLNVKTTFLHGDLEEEIYIYEPT